MNIDSIIYDTTRPILNVEDKLSITSLILFCYELGSKVFCKLLYTDNHEDLISELSEEYSDYKIDLSIRLDDKLVSDCFKNTIDKVREKHDSNGYLKALYEGDEFALVICGIVNTDISKILKKC